MLASLSVQDWTSIVGACANVALVSGLGIAYYQIRSERRGQRANSTLEAQSSLITGEVGAARRRLGDFSYRLAVERGMATRMVRPLWEDLHRGTGTSWLSPVGDALGEDLISDVFLFARAFRRIETQITRGLLDEDLAFDLVGWDAVYWHVFFSRIDAKRVESLVALAKLAKWAWDEALRRRLTAGSLTSAISLLEQGERPDGQARWLSDLETDFWPVRRDPSD